MLAFFLGRTPEVKQKSGNACSDTSFPRTMGKNQKQGGVRREAFRQERFPVRLKWHRQGGRCSCAHATERRIDGERLLVFMRSSLFFAGKDAWSSKAKCFFRNSVSPMTHTTRAEVHWHFFSPSEGGGLITMIDKVLFTSPPKNDLILD